jgi:hypothetical protein
MRHAIPIALAFGTLSVLPTLHAATRSAGKHEHGTSTLSIAVDGTNMAIDLDGPADNLMGFEHKPSTPEQTAVLAKALDVLRAGENLFLTPPGADCRMVSAAVSPPDYNTDGGPDGHSDLEASWEFRCGNPAALLWVDVQLFAKFPGTQKLAAGVVTPAGQKAVVLTPGTPRVLLPRPVPAR